MMPTKKLLTAVVAGLLTAACGVGGASTIAHQGTLRIGVKFDQPSIGLRDAHGNFTGFDVDVATYVAKKLGATPVFVPVTLPQRPQFLKDHKVDMVVASYSITQDRKTAVTFAGPYYVAHQDIMVRAQDTAVHTVHNLAGRTLCAVAGADSAPRVTDEMKVAAKLVPGQSDRDCMGKLAAGQIDAVSTDDVIMAGLASLWKPGTFRLVGAPFTDERMGIGLPHGDIEACEDVNKAITDMFLDGTAARLLHKWFDASGLQPTTTVPQFEGCG